MNVWKAFPLLQVTANPLSTNEQTGLATVFKPIKTQQELWGTQGPITTWELMPEEKIPCLERVCTIHCMCTGPVYVSLLVSPSLFTASNKDLFLGFTRDHCIVFNEPASVPLEVKHKGSGLSLLGCNWFTSPTALWFTIGGCPQELSKNMMLTLQATVTVFILRDLEKITNQVHSLQCITSWICEGWVDNKPYIEFDKSQMLQSSDTLSRHFSNAAWKFGIALTVNKAESALGSDKPAV